MAYKRLDETYVDGQVWDEAAVTRIDDSFERVYGDFYDNKVDVTYEFVSQTCNVNSPSFNRVFDYSTFSGWCACIGNPSEIGSIKFPVKARADQPIVECYITIYELPDVSNVTIGTTAPSPAPYRGTVLGSTKVTFDNPITRTDAYTVVQADFSNQINNDSKKYLAASITFPCPITFGIVNQTFDDIPYNPWYYYASGGGSATTAWPSGYANGATVPCLPVAIYSKNISDEYSVLSTETKGKFFNLVNDCINNSEAFGTLFEERYNPKYSIGTSNLIVSDPATTYDQWGAFTGCCFYIGEVPKSYTADGVSLSIYSRSLNGATTPITKVWAYLYEVEQVPLYSSQIGFGSLKPVLVRSGVAEVNIPVDKTEVVTIFWDEPYVNTSGKKLMLGYNTNQPSSRRFTGRDAEKAIGDIDGNTYNSAFYSYYAATNNMITGNWNSGWEDTYANAWCFVTKEKVYDFGDKFYNILEEALGETQIQTAPSSEVRLAKQYDLVVGDTFQLFYEGVIKSFAPLNEGIRVKCSVGRQFPRYFEFKPTETNSGKTYTLNLSTRRLDGTVISEGVTKLVVHPKLTNDTTPSNINMLLFGDSLTGGGIWCSEGLRRIYGANNDKTPASLGVTNTVTTYGGVSNANNSYYNNTFPVNHEGHSGWTWGSFLSKSSGSSTTSQLIVVLDSDHNYDLLTVQKSSWTDNNGLVWELEDLPSENSIKFNRGEGNSAAQSTITLPTSLTSAVLGLTISNISAANWSSSNPFYDELTGEISVKAHANKYGISQTDIAACLLTWNGASPKGDFNNDTTIEGHMEKAATILRQIHTDFPDCKVICLGIQINDLNGGCGSAYGATGDYSDTYATAFYAFDYNKALEELCTSDEFKNYCYYVDTKGQFDSRYNMPAKYKAVNTRNTGITELIGSNGLHPYQTAPHEPYDTGSYGYFQIGDAFYRALTKVIPTITK